MAPYERVLVATDGSPASERAIREALDLAVANDASVHVLYVLDTTSFAPVSGEATLDGMADILESEGEDALDAVAEQAAARGLTVERALVEGRPSAEIAGYAERADCDVIVMGTHGRGGLDRLLLGSVAEKVVRTASVPVLTVRAAKTGVEADGEPESGEREPI
jgi:nucleotide-binding universal stress UspA family protein